MAYSVAVIQSGIYAQMQSAKAFLLMLICTVLLGACGLRGPLYLPEETPADEQRTDQAAGTGDKSEDEKEDEKDKPQLPASGQ